MRYFSSNASSSQVLELECCQLIPHARQKAFAPKVLYPSSFTSATVLSTMKSLGNSLSLRLDCLNSSGLQTYMDVEYVTELLVLSLVLANTPLMWKMASITVIPKSEKLLSDSSLYRITSLASTVAQVLKMFFLRRCGFRQPNMTFAPCTLLLRLSFCWSPALPLVSTSPNSKTKLWRRQSTSQKLLRLFFRSNWSAGWTGILI